MKFDIDRLTEAELIDLNHRVVERLRFLAQMRAHGAILQFTIGERVSFTPPARPTLGGVLVKYNKKTVTVVTDDGRRWNVAPSYLRKPELKDVTPRQGELIQLEGPDVS